jgi:hypothetical protein
MAELKHGTITVMIPDHIPLPENAGSLTSVELARLEKPRRGLGLACQKTAEAIRKHPGKLAACGVDPDLLDAKGAAAEDIDSVINDLEVVLAKLKQGNALLDVDANKELRKVLAFIRAQEKFDPSIPSLVPVLIDYFSNTRPTQTRSSPDPTPEK